jgi:transcriptional regulator, lysR family
MELRVLRYFLAAIREGSILRAAHFLHITQPTLSRQLQDLEEELGQKLLIRTNRSVALTAEGKLLRRRAEDIMEIVRKTEAEFRSMGENIRGDVYIGSGETEAMKLIARIIRELREEYPGIRYHIYSGKTEEVEERVDKGILDFGILIQPINISKYDCINLPLKDVWGVIMRKDSPLAAKESISFRDLQGLPLICSRQNPQSKTGKSGYPEWFGRLFDKLNVVATYNLIYNAAQLVEEGIGYAIGLDRTIDTMEHSVLCFRPLSPKVESGLNIVWKKYQVFSTAAEIFLDRIQKDFSAAEDQVRR